MKKCIFFRKMKTPKGMKTHCKYDGSIRNSCQGCKHFKKPLLLRWLEGLDLW